MTAKPKRFLMIATTVPTLALSACLGSGGSKPAFVTFTTTSSIFGTGKVSSTSSIVFGRR